MTATVNAARIDRGRWHEYVLDGEKVPGVTTILNGGWPKPNLIEWAKKITAQHCWDNREAMTQLDEASFMAVAIAAADANRDAAALAGTRVHAHAETVANGGVPEDVNEDDLGKLDQYLHFIADFDVKFVTMETAVFNRTYGYGGTFDAVARIPALGDGNTLLDYKTGRSGAFPEHALQLAAYRHAETYLDDAGAEQPMDELEIERAAILWLRRDDYELVVADTSGAVFRSFLYVQQTAAIRKELDKGVTQWLSAPVLAEAKARRTA